MLIELKLSRFLKTNTSSF